MWVWNAPSESSRNRSTTSVKSSQESLQTAKGKEKKEKRHASRDLKERFKIKV